MQLRSSSFPSIVLAVLSLLAISPDIAWITSGVHVNNGSVQPIAANSTLSESSAIKSCVHPKRTELSLPLYCTRPVSFPFRVSVLKHQQTTSAVPRHHLLQLKAKHFNEDMHTALNVSSPFSPPIQAFVVLPLGCFACIY